MPNQEPPTPKVFVSYSWTSEEHQKWVLGLAQRLVSDGVDVVIDRWDLERGQDKFVFMERMVQDDTITKVLMVCDEAYVNKANGRKGGVGDETQIITPQIYGAVNQNKFLPIVAERDHQNKPYLPNYLKSRIYFDLSDPLRFEEEYVDLKHTIVGKPYYKKPPLGKLSKSLTEDDETLSTTSKFLTVKSAILQDRSYAIGAADDYLEELERSLEALRFVLKSGVSVQVPEVEEQILGNIKAFLPYRDEFIEFINFLCRYSASDRLFESVQRFFVSVSPRMFPSFRSEGEVYPDVHQFLVPEMFLYTLTSLIKHGRFAETNIFLGASYPYGTELHASGMGSYRLFTIYMEHVDVWQRNKPPRGYYNRETASLGLLIERAIHKSISYLDLTDTDFALYVRSFLNPADNQVRDRWIPVTLASSIHSMRFTNGVFPSFSRGVAHNDFQKLCVLLNVSDKADLIKRFEDACENGRIEDSGGRLPTDGCLSMRRSINLEALDTI